MFRNLALALILTAVFAATPALPQDSRLPAGTVARVQGSALAVQNAVPRVLKAGDVIQIGDVLSTGPDAHLEITMRDQAVFTLGSQTAFVVVDYTFGQGAPANGVVRVLQGAFLATSGSIAQLAEATGGGGLKVQTTVATIGIRGTTVWGGTLDGAPMQVMLIDGKSVTVENENGRVELNTPGAGTTVNATGGPTSPANWAADKVARARAITDFR